MIMVPTPTVRHKGFLDSSQSAGHDVNLLALQGGVDYFFSNRFVAIQLGITQHQGLSVLWARNEQQNRLGPSARIVAWTVLVRRLVSSATCSYEAGSRRLSMGFPVGPACGPRLDTCFPQGGVLVYPKLGLTGTYALKTNSVFSTRVLGSLQRFRM